MCNPILLSIKPKFSNKIIAQTKKIEIRKKIGRHFYENNTVFIYSSSPDKKIVGFFQIDSIIKFNSNNIDEKLLLDSCLDIKEMLSYTSGKEAYGIKIKNFKAVQPISLELLRDKFPKFSPPQSYFYINSSIQKFIEEMILFNQNK